MATDDFLRPTPAVGRSSVVDVAATSDESASAAGSALGIMLTICSRALGRVRGSGEQSACARPDPGGRRQ